MRSVLKISPSQAGRNLHRWKVSITKESHEFLVPDYYPAFACKMGACRHACCEGWPVSFSRQDYFNLLGVACSAQLREKLDCAMHLADYPTPEEYAQITPRFDGACPMRLVDGRCGLQAELGEDALAAVCRLYPRGVRRGGGYECSCANSCEAVPELLLHRTKPITFQKCTLTTDVPPEPERHEPPELTCRRQAIRLWLIAQIQSRDYSLPQRFQLLHEALTAMEKALSRQDWARVDALTTGQEMLPEPDSLEHNYETVSKGLKKLDPILEYIVENSESIRAYGQSIFGSFRDEEAAVQHYMASRQHFETLLPQWETWFEHLLVNHMYFTQFPFQDPPVPLGEEFLALCGVYALLRFLCIGWAAEHGTVEEIVDVAAAAFRLIDHTDFNRYAASLLHQAGCSDREHLRQLICL